MLVSDEVHRTLSQKTKQVLTISEKLREALKLSKSNWASYLEVKPSEYERLLKQQKAFSALSLFRLCERLDLNVSAFQTGSIDYEAVYQLHRGNTAYINPKYLVAAYSKKFSMINMLNFVERRRGPCLRTSLSRNFQISEEFWKNDFSGSINYRLITEALSYLQGRGFAPEDFHAMGVHSGNTLRGSEIGNRLGSCRRTKDVYDLLFSEVIFKMEHNCNYKLSGLTAQGCTVEMRSHPEVAEAFQVKHLGNLASCDVKRGILAAMPTFMGESLSNVRETQCVHRGDARCRFKLDFPLPRTVRGSRASVRLLC